MTNSIFQGKQHRALEDRAVTASQAIGLKVPDLLRIGLGWVLDQIENGGGVALTLGAPRALEGAQVARKEKADFLTPKTHRRVEELDSTLGGGWFELRFQDMLETAIAEDWDAETVKPHLPAEVTFSQCYYLKSLRERWRAEDQPRATVKEKGLTDGKVKPGRKKKPHPLFGDTPRGRKAA